MPDYGLGPFDNDTAREWLGELADAADLSLLVDVVGEVADLSDVEPLDTWPAERAVAAVAVVAACYDGGSADLPEAARAWVTAAPRSIPNHLARKAGRALERVLRDSALNDAWSESPDHGAWVRAIETLRARLP